MHTPKSHCKWAGLTCGVLPNAEQQMEILTDRIIYHYINVHEFLKTKTTYSITPISLITEASVLVFSYSVRLCAEDSQGSPVEDRALPGLDSSHSIPVCM